MKTPKIAVVGSANMDIVIETPHFPKIGETISGTKVSYYPGGKGANQAIAAARLGARSTLIAALGKDVFGRVLYDNLKTEAVNIDEIIQLEGIPSGIASITLYENDNCIIVVPGANGHLKPEHVEYSRHIIEDSEIVMLQLEIPLETVEAAVHIAKQSGTIVILNPAPARELPLELLKQVDFITPNESEIGLLTGMVITQDNLEQAVDILLGFGVGHVIATLGEKGFVYKTKGAPMVTFPAHKVEVVDTTGAGDTFNAALAYALILYGDILKALRFANFAGALSVTREGAQSGMPSLPEVEHLADAAAERAVEKRR